MRRWATWIVVCVFLPVMALGQATPTATPTPVQGWTQVDSDVEMSGLVLYGDKNGSTQDMAGLAGFTQTAQISILPHFASTARWYTGVVVMNPNGTEANVLFKAYKDDGTLWEVDAHRTLPAYGKISELVSDLFDGAVSGTGWIEVWSTQNVAAFELYGDKISGGIASLPCAEVGHPITLGHFVHSSRWWTGIVVLNPSSAPVEISLAAYVDGGDKLAIEPHPLIVNAHAKLSGMVESLIPETANQTGWISALTGGEDLVAMVVYGDRQATPNRIAALMGVYGSTTACLSDFHSDADWWTGVSIVNPSKGSANVTLSAYTPYGSLIQSKSLAIDPLSRTLSLVGSLFDLSGQPRGRLELSSASTIVALEVLSANDSAEQAWGLSAVESQSAATKFWFPHQMLTTRWWTLFSIANPNAGSASVYLNAVDGGTIFKTVNYAIPGKGSISDYLKVLLQL